MQTVRTITVYEKRAPNRRVEEHAYDENHYRKQASRFGNIFKLWTEREWAVEPDEDEPGRWVVWNSKNEEIATGNSAIQALESAINKTRPKRYGKSHRPTHGK